MPNNSVRMGSNRSMYGYEIRWPKHPFMPKMVKDSLLQMKLNQTKKKPKKRK